MTKKTRKVRKIRVKKKLTGMKARWPGKLSTGSFVPVSSFFLEHNHRLEPKLNSTSVLLIIHILDFKWTDDAPFPSLSRLATRMNLSKRHIRSTLRNLEEAEYLTTYRPTRTSQNRIDFTPLYQKLERIMEKLEPTETSN